MRRRSLSGRASPPSCAAMPNPILQFNKPVLHLELDSASIKIARKNSNKFMFYLYFFDVFWLALISYLGRGDMFDYEFIGWGIILKGIAIFVCIIFYGIAFNKLHYVLPKKNINFQIFKISVMTSVILNVLSVLFISASARYTSAGLTGISGLYYFLTLIINYFAFTLIIKNISVSRRIKYLIFLHGFSLLFRIDGLAEALNAVLMIYLYVSTIAKNMRFNQIIAMCVLVVGLILFGLKIKFNDDLSLEYIVDYIPIWIVERFGIHAFQWAMSLGELSIINTASEYFEVALNSFLLRIDLICACGMSSISQFKSISEAMFYDLYGLTGSGSSPGVMTSITILGAWGFIIVIFNSLIIRAIFQGVNHEFNFMQILSMTLIYKIIFVDVSEYVGVISVLPYVLFGIIIASLLSFNKKTEQPAIFSSDAKS